MIRMVKNDKNGQNGSMCVYKYFSFFSNYYIWKKINQYYGYKKGNVIYPKVISLD